MQPEIDKSNVGKNARIIAVRNPQIPSHACMIGQTGYIEKAVASRNIYRIRLADGKTWDALPENVKVMT